ncbi:MAG: ABC transporter substrate-binding protein [Burkholderiaceae bacterium]
MKRNLHPLLLGLTLAFTSLLPLTASAQTLRVGLAEDPDALDPTMARTFVGRIVFDALCDKLVDVDEKLNYVPQLATKWAWSDDGKSLTMTLRDGVTFHDGEKFDAQAVSYNIDRHKNMKGTRRGGDLKPVTGVEVMDPLTVKINLSAPYQPLLAALADRAGMMVSPKAAEAGGEGFALKPVCSGPFKFAERIAQDKIVLERFDGYWGKADIHFDKVVYLPIPDATVRLANLKSGQLDFIERVAASDMAGLQKEGRFKTAAITEIGYQGLTLNVNNGEQAKTSALHDPRVREAFELSLDRDGIVQVVMEGQAEAGNQWVSPGSAFYAKSVPPVKRDVARAKALLKEAGVTKPTVKLLAATTSDAQKIAQVVQAMSAEAGFDVKIQTTEFATSLNMATKGEFEAYILAWSGRADPDGNLYIFHGCKQALNYSGYCTPEMDALLNLQRTQADPAARQATFEKIAQLVAKEKAVLYLYHRKWLWAYVPALSGVRDLPDGLLRVRGLKLN